MSLKINVIYDGIIYRVKGMKVLCSVVLAVIILLIAIVAMGVWMLVTVYDDDQVINAAFNSSIASPSLKTNSSAPFIDFKNPMTSEKSIVVANLETTTEFKEPSSTERSKSAPEPNLAVFGAGLYDLAEKETTHEEEFIPSRKLILNQETLVDSLAPFSDHFDGVAKLPPNFDQKVDEDIFPDVATRVVEPMVPDAMENPANEPIPKLIAADLTKAEKEIITTEIPKSDSREFSHRSGDVNKGLTYIGPPVVGYGLDPYKRLSNERLEEYNTFWKHYGGGESHSLLRPQGNTRIERKPIRGPMKPHLRGLRPTATEYDVPVRPDAQVPSQDPDSNLEVSSIELPRGPPPPIQKISYQPNIRRRRPESNPNYRRIPSKDNLERRLRVGTQPTSSPKEKVHSRPSGPTVSSRPGSPILGPLQDLYDYSKRLAATILNFNMKSDNQIKESSDKMGAQGIKLLEDYNSVFSMFSGGPLNALANIIPTTERLRELDPFELSLVTWTFLDFWEFLIEKVGTLSDEDLELLQERLDKLRKRKDNIMTQAFVNETMTHMADNTGRSQSDEQNPDGDPTTKNITVNEAPAINSSMDITSLQNDEGLAVKQRSISDIHGSLNVTALTQVLNKDYDKDRINLSANIFTGKILENLFPNLTEDHTTRIPIKESPSVDFAVSKDTNSTAFDRFSSPLNITEIISMDPFILDLFEPRSGRMWDPMGLFSSQGRMQFMQFAVKVVFNFGKVYLKKPYALDCLMLLFCKDLNQNTNKGGMEGMAAKLKSVGLKVLTESDQQLRESDTFHEIWRSVTAWSPLQCDTMFPRCDGSKALEIVNEVALGSNNN